MPIERLLPESRRRPNADLAMTMPFTRRSKCEVNLPLYVQVDASSEARLPPPVPGPKTRAGEPQ